MSLLQLTPDQIISDIHTVANEMGGRRVRVDRTEWSGDGLPAAWIEVGYGSGEIHIRTSLPRLRYRRATDEVEMDDVIDLIDNLLTEAK